MKIRSKNTIVILSYFVSTFFFCAFIYKNLEYKKIEKKYNNYVKETTAKQSQDFVTWFIQNEPQYKLLKDSGFKDVSLNSTFNAKFEGLIATELVLRATLKANKNNDAIRRHEMVRAMYPGLLKKLFVNKVVKLTGDNYCFNSLFFTEHPFHSDYQGRRLVPAKLINKVFAIIVSPPKQEDKNSVSGQ